MRVLGIETSSPRGSIALCDGAEVVCELEHRRENAHGESIQPLIEQALASVGWSLGSLDRVAVGTGPGSFTGLRVGIALAQGISEGLEVPLIGVGSLAAMAAAVPASEPGLRCPVADARHGELFAALYSPTGEELLEPWLAPDLNSIIQRAKTFAADVVCFGPHTELPHARWTARLALAASASTPILPLYVRQVVAVRPRLPPNPLRPG